MSFDVTALPDDVATLKALFTALHAQYSTVQAENVHLRAQLFGRKSEKLSLEDIRQSRLFNEIEAEAAKGGELFAPDEDDAIAVPAHSRGKPGRRRFPDDLERRTVLIDLSEAEKQCACGHTMERIGEETSEKLDIIPPQLIVIEHVRPKYACKHCAGALDEQRPAVRIAPVMPTLLPKSSAAPGLLAYVATAKFTDALPFYRVERIFARIGVELSRATLCNWMIRLRGHRNFRRLLALLRGLALSGPVLHSDETPVKVIRNPRAQSYMWVFLGGSRDRPAVWFWYRPTRHTDFLKKFLRRFRGVLVTDGYAGYDKLLGKVRGIRHAGCWAHVRRMFFKLWKQAKDSPAANHALAVIRALYKIEHQARVEQLAPEQIHALRQEQAKPLIEDFKLWLDATALQTPPQGLLGKAIHYTLGQWPKLLVYLEDGNVPIDNNADENKIRPFVVGRKNWLFAMVERGIEASAALYTLVENAKANGLEPYWYLRHLFTHLATASTREQLMALLPQFVDHDAVRPLTPPTGSDAEMSSKFESVVP